MLVFTDEQVTDMRARYRARNISLTGLQKETGKSRTTLIQMLKGRTYEHLNETASPVLLEMPSYHYISPKKNPKTTYAIQTLINRKYSTFQIVQIVIANGTTMQKNRIYKTIKELNAQPIHLNI